MADLNTAWTALTERLLGSVPGVLLLGVLSNALFAGIKRVLAAVATYTQRAADRNERWTAIDEYLQTGPDKALIVHVATALGAMVWWLMFAVFGFLVSYQTRKDLDNNSLLFMTVGAYWALYQAAGWARTLKTAHKKFIERPVEALMAKRKQVPASAEAPSPQP